MKKTVVVGVSGGVAAYKALDVVSRLKKMNYTVKVIMTRNACKFVTPLSFEAVSGEMVYTEMFDEPKAWEIQHISLAKEADLMIVVPATANIIGKVANGIADDMLSTTIMATEAKVLFSPAMNSNMYANKIVQSNLDKLKKFGYEVIPPAEGRLACGDIGRGKLPDTELISEIVNFSVVRKNDLKGKKVLITAGPTIARIDPVRYITNWSSGKMGYALAEEARDRGADVTVVSGPSNEKKAYGIRYINVETTQEMYNEVMKIADQQDIIVKNAAVADYSPEVYSEQKIKKTGDKLTIDLVKGKDILYDLGNRTRKYLLIGFAAESENIIANGIAKIKKKNVDYLVVNDISDSDIGFKSSENEGYLISKHGDEVEIPRGSKREMARSIFQNILNSNN